MTDVPSCYHCGLPCDIALAANIKGVRHCFCCIGCQAVTEAIVGGGLGAFYRHREGLNPRADTQSSEYQAYDLSDVQNEFVTELPNGYHQAHLYLQGITCAACVWLIEKHLAKQAGVVAVRVNAGTHAATITYIPEDVKLSSIMRALDQIGYCPQPLLDRDLRQIWQTRQRSQLMRLGVAGIGMMQAGMVAVALHAGDLQGIEPVWMQILRWVNLLFTLPIILYSAVPFYQAAWRALKARHLVMDVSVSLALLLAFSASFYATVTGVGDVYYDSVAMFTFFLLLGRYFESRVRWQNFSATSQSQQLIPFIAEKLTDGQRESVPLRSVMVGDVLRVAAGSVVPCDGVVVQGTSETDESVLTGEAFPQPKEIGDDVYAGSHNGSAALDIEVRAVGRNTQLATIERLVDQAEQDRPRQVALADRLAGWFVAAVLVTTTVVALVWYWIEPARAIWVALSVLVVTCPCALSLATPTVITAAISRLRQSGVLVTASQSLEVLEKADTVVFDKTGTLTNGQLEIADVLILDKQFDKTQILNLVAALEDVCHHPIAKAFSTISPALLVRDRKVVIGRGVSGCIDGKLLRFGSPDYALPDHELAFPSAGLWLLLSDIEKPLAWVSLRDELRPCAVDTVAQLQRMGLHVVLMSGDREDNVRSVAELVQIAQWHAGMLPEDKLAKVRQMQSAGHRVLMLGDGINDVPVLSGADVSCAMGSATNLAQTKADCVLLGNDLRELPKVFSTAQQTRRVIKQNMGWALAYNLIALPAAVSGLVPPWLAAIGMSSSSLVVVLNALRVGR